MKELTIEAKTENAERAAEFVDAELEAMDCPMKAQMQINIAVDEIFSNVAFYAYAPEAGEITIRVERKEDPPTAILTFIDNGKAYDPLQAADPDVSLGAEERGVGGLGIFIVKKTMDAVRYARRDGQNILQIEKRLAPTVRLPE